MTIKNHIRIIYLGCFILFLVNKIVVRPFVFEDRLTPFLNVISLSIPNFFEAVMGTVTVVAILLFLKFKKITFLQSISDRNLKIGGILFATVFVITQELKYHNIGGRNVYDVNDLIASVMGLVFIGIVIFRDSVVSYREI